MKQLDHKALLAAIDTTRAYRYQNYGDIAAEIGLVQSVFTKLKAKEGISLPSYIALCEYLRCPLPFVTERAGKK